MKVTFLGLCLMAAAAGAPPAMPNDYFVSGVLELPYAVIKEPFTAYFNGAKNRSRVDYYGTSVQTYQLPGDGVKTFGKSYKVVYMTTEEKVNQRSCFQANGTKDAAVTTQTLFPDLSDFHVVDMELMDSQNCTKWQNVTVIGNKKNVYSLWWSNTENRPVRYEMYGYDSLLGSHYDKYYVLYQAWEKNYNFSDTDFTPNKNLTCSGFPGPGDAEDLVLQNPMKEYIHNDDSHVHHMFQSFKKSHSKSYSGQQEHDWRKDIFRHNVRYIHSKNRAGLGYSLAVNHMADMTDKEMKLMRGYRHSKGYNGGQPFTMSPWDVNAIPDQVDWRLYGAVTQVKDQAVCGSCWSFGTVGAVEGAFFMKTSKLVRLSQQELVDCSWGYGNNGCDGGEDFRAYQWIMKHGLASEEDYGLYTGQDQKCVKDSVNATVKMKSYVNVTSGDLQALKVAIAKYGPISVAIDASHKSLSFYSNGVYFEPQCGSDPDSLDHAVLAVGYGVINGEPYWLVKNSWSTYWGNSGYVLMSQKKNNCGVATAATYVVM